MGGRYKERRICLRDLTFGERLSSRYVYIARGAGDWSNPLAAHGGKAEKPALQARNAAIQPRRYDGPATL